MRIGAAGRNAGSTFTSIQFSFTLTAIFTMTKKSIATYVVAGLDAENHELLIQRIAKYCDTHNEVLNALINGIVIDAAIDDADKLASVVDSRSKKKTRNHSINVIDNEIKVRYEYTKTVYYTEDGKDWNWSKSEKYTVPKDREDNNTMTFSVDEAETCGISVFVV